MFPWTTELSAGLPKFYSEIVPHCLQFVVSFLPFVYWECDPSIFFSILHLQNSHLDMRKQIDYFITAIRSILEGEPWYGQPAIRLLQSVDPKNAYKKPNDHSHSLIELLYHMVTWAEFALKRLQRDEEKDMAAFEKLDWREINPQEHTWEKGIAQFKVTHDLIIELLGTKEDEFLSEKVDYRDYNFRFLLHGVIQHDIYHLGQIAYVKTLLTA